MNSIYADLTSWESTYPISTQLILKFPLHRGVNQQIDATTVKVIVDGAYRDRIRVVGGLIIANGNIFIYWSINFKTCHGIDYVETIVIL